MAKSRVESNTNRTLGDEEVLFYRGEYFATPRRLTARQIMERTDLSMVSVRRMLTGETYRHLGIARLADLRKEQAREKQVDEEARASAERMKAWVRENKPEALVEDLGDPAEEMLKELGELYGEGEKT